MRVVMFMEDLSATGVVTNAVDIAGELHARGCDVRLVAANPEGTLKSRVADGIPVVGLLGAASIASSRKARLRRAVLSYRRYVKSARPDVIFSAGNHAHLASLIAASAAPGARTILRISNDLRHGLGGSRNASRWWRMMKTRLIAARADQLVFVSRHLRDQAAAIADICGKSVVIPNGVDVAKVRSRASEACPHPWFGDGRSAPVVLAVGRLVEQKNFVSLVRAVAVAHGQRPLRLVLIGSGPLREEILDAARSLEIGDSIDIIASVENPMPYMARASVVALPSLWEGSSNVLLEAIACRTPVVASRTAGSAAEVLDDGRYGVLVDPADVEGMATALLHQCSGSAVRPGERGQAFSREAMLRSYADLILGGTAG